MLKRRDGTVTGDVMEMDSILRESWLPVFAKHGDGKSPEPSVGAFVEGFGHHTPTHKQDLIDIEPDDIVALVMKLPSNGAGGLDGWKPMDLKRLGPEILGSLVHLFGAVEKCGRCPHAPCWEYLPSSERGKGGEDPLGLRPITVTPVVYRVWAALRTRQCMAWQEEWIHKGQHGARAKHSTTDALFGT